MDSQSVCLHSLTLILNFRLVEDSANSESHAYYIPGLGNSYTPATSNMFVHVSKSHVD